MKRYDWWPDCMHEQAHGVYARFGEFAKEIRAAVDVLEDIPRDDAQRLANRLSRLLEPASAEQQKED